MTFKERVCFMKWVMFISLFSDYYGPTTCLIIEDLGGIWNVQNAQKGYDLPATVPGGIYSDLMKNNIIGDVFYGFNDEKTRWVSKLNWNYSRSFTVNEKLLAHENINLVFDGVDTFSKILINNVVVGSTENMFVRYVFDIKPHLQLGNNTISVQFESPVNMANLLFEKQAKDHIVPPKCVPNIYNGECHVNHIRKMQASFAWDWGPAFPSVGIWKKVYLEAYNSTVLRDITVNVVSNTATNHWEVQLNIYLAENSSSHSIQGTLLVEILTDIEKITNIYKINIIKNADGDYVTTHNVSIPKSYVKLWWPNGYGEAKLYLVNVAFISPSKAEKSVKRIKVGFRTVDLVQNVMVKGRTFYFKVNGVPIFAKGANSVPINILPELGQNEKTVRFLLQSAKDVHMNMLRVWGGGTYESDIYYELADEMGIMIWQDFMFACSMYPANDEFLRTVASEVKHQVRRLQHHPSIVIWAGNNENEAALRQNWYGTHENFTLYKNDYKELYVNTIKMEVLLNDNTRPYLTSSPTNGIESDTEDYVAENPQSHFYGDVHFYNYILDGWKTTVYPVNRFASEFGYQSMPSIDTWLTATNNTKNLMMWSRFMKSRQHHPLGYGEMQSLINNQLVLPSENSTNFFRAFIFYSQIIQAQAIKIETEYYRMWRSNVNDIGEGLTMGALYWQLNDVWVAPSWASIDFKNNWKMLHYYAKNFFAPVIITGNLTIDKKVNIYVISDLMKPIHNVTVTINIFKWDSFVPVYERRIQTDVIPGTSRIIKTYAIQKLSSDEDDPCGKQMTKNCFIYITLRNKKNNLIAPNNYVFLTPLKTANLTIATVKISTISQIDNAGTQFRIQIETNEIALFVWLNAKEVQGRFSENGFLLVTPTRIIYFYANESTTVAELKSSLSITHLLHDDYM